MENWNNILFNAMHSHAPKIGSLIYLISWLFIGNYVFLNLFLAIMLDGFDQDTFKSDIEEGFEIAPNIELDNQSN